MAEEKDHTHSYPLSSVGLCTLKLVPACPCGQLRSPDDRRVTIRCKEWAHFSAWFQREENPVGRNAIGELTIGVPCSSLFAPLLVDVTIGACARCGTLYIPVEQLIDKAF